MVAFAALGLVGAIAGPAAAASASDAAATAAPAATTQPSHDIVRMIGDALAEVHLRPDQAAAVDKLYKQVRPLQDEADGIMQTLLLALADQVQAGHVDDEALDPTIEAAAVARKGLIVAIRGSLEQLHLILDPDQRTDFVDALEARIHEVLAANAPERRFEDLATELSLNDVQKQEVHDALDQLVTMMRAAQREAHQVLEALRGDTFSLEQIQPERDILPKVEARVEMIVEAAESITDVLDSAQQAKYADEIRKLAHAQESAPR
jgi:Spy/CpxP family protein refolding chaperone